MTTEQIKTVQLDTQPAQTSIKELRTELKKLKDTMLSTEQGTEEYNKALLQAAEIQHTLKEQMELVNATAMDFGQITSNVTKSIGGMVAGFQAVNAVMNLFGIENEDVLQSLKKMQNIMALTQSFSSIDAGIKAFSRLGLAIKSAAVSAGALKTALISTGIGALVVAVGELAANWDKVSEALQKYGIISDKQLEEDKKKVDELRGKVADLHGQYEDWAKKEKISKLNENAKKSYDNLSKAIEGYQLQLDEVVAKQALPENQSRKNWEALQAEGKQYQENIRLLKSQQDAILANADSFKELDKSAIRALETANEKLRQMQIELGIAEQDANRLINPFLSLEEKLAAKGSVWEIPVKVTVEEDDEFEDDDIADTVRKRVESVVEGLRNAFTTEQEQYEMEISALQTALNTKLISQEEYNKLSEELSKEHLEKQRQTAQQEIAAWASVGSTIGDIFSSLGDLMEENSKEQKAMQIMAATINMLAGIATALSGAFTTKSGPWDIALAVVQAAAIATSAGVTIAKIAKTTKQNASSMANSASSSPSMSGINSVIAPVQYTQDVQGANIEQSINGISSKVYVTETDITNTQNKVKVTENEARF